MKKTNWSYIGTLDGLFKRTKKGARLSPNESQIKTAANEPVRKKLCDKKAPGIYKLVALNEKGSEKSFGRIKGESSIIYVGKTGRPLLHRLKEFWRTVSKEKDLHSAGAHYKYLRLGRIVPLSRIGVWVSLCGAREIKTKEALELQSYAKKHKEFPPLNRSFPGQKA